MEIWKPVIGFEGFYEVSNLGNVRSLPVIKKGNGDSFYTKKGKVLKPALSHGYLFVVFCVNSKRKIFKVHQLVAMSFLNHVPCGMKLVVNHKNFDKADNNVSNLEIVTSRENSNKKHIKSSSKFIGVHFDKQSCKWKSKIEINGVTKHLGYFIDEEEASKAYEEELEILMSKK